jgi:hypothetical protein
MNKILFFLLLSISNIAIGAESANVPVPFTLADKERIIRVEERMNAKFEAIDARFNAIDARFDAIDSKFLSLESRFALLEKLIFLMIATVLGFVGFVLWDRKAGFKPFEAKDMELDAKYKTLLDIMKDLAKTNKEVETTLRLRNLL